MSTNAKEAKFRRQLTAVEQHKAELKKPVYLHTGQLWPVLESNRPDPEYVRQQVLRLEGEEIARDMEGAHFLFCNDYEFGLISKKTGWSLDQILDHVKTLVITRGKDGADLYSGTDAVTTRLSNSVSGALSTSSTSTMTVTQDRTVSAHYEHTVLVTKTGYDILTLGPHDRGR